MKKRLLALILVFACALSLACAAAPVRAVETETAPAAAEEPVVSAKAEAEPEESPTEAEESAPPEESPAAEPEEETSAQPMAEPSSGPWYAEAMDYAVAQGLLKGDDHGNLNPGNNATRAEVVTILMRIFHCTQGKDITHFFDVDSGAWYYGALSTAAEMDVLKGYPDVTMRPGASITRQEAFVLLARLFAVPSGSSASLNAFSDGASVSEWARPAVAGMVENGLVIGSSGSLLPGSNITRAEFVQVLYRLNITLCSSADALPEDGIVVYNGPSPLAIDGFAGKLFLGGRCGSSVTLTGDAPAAELYVRTEPGATVQVNGAVKGVFLCARNTTLAGTGRAAAVEQRAAGCTVRLAADTLSQSYDSGLAGVRAQVGPVAALTPENRSVTVTVSYSGGDYTAAPSGRTATLTWTLDGVRQPARSVWLGYSTSVETFTVSEPVWKRVMPGSHQLHILLTYGTDVIVTDVTIQVQNYTDAEYMSLLSAAKPFQIEVVRNQCTVLVYGLDKSGSYTILYQAFVCSPGYATPLGTFRTPAKMRWQPLMGGVWGQYCTQIYGNYLFHSVYYNSKSESNLNYTAYNKLGTICSHGCVRLTCADAKWLYDNCPLGTTVRIYDSNTLPVPKPTAQWIDPSSPYRGWDPTDPNPNNPWRT